MKRVVLQAVEHADILERALASLEMMMREEEGETGKRHRTDASESCQSARRRGRQVRVHAFISGLGFA